MEEMLIHFIMMSRKLLALITILATGFFAGGVNSMAQSVPRSKPVSRPAKLGLDRLIRSNFKDYFGEKEWQYIIMENFYPIGWSKDGKLAYLLEPENEDCDCYVAIFRIQDLRTDKILWEHRYESELLSLSKRKETIDSFWRANRKLFSATLREHRIEAQQAFVLHRPQVNFRDDLIAPQVRIERDESYSSPGQISKIVLQVNSKRQGGKIGYERSYALDEFSSLVDAKVVGHLKSPFAPLIAFLMVEVHWGWEGPPHTSSIRIVGSNLSGGFPSQRTSLVNP